MTAAGSPWLHPIMLCSPEIAIYDEVKLIPQCIALEPLKGGNGKKKLSSIAYYHLSIKASNLREKARFSRFAKFCFGKIIEVRKMRQNETVFT